MPKKTNKWNSSIVCYSNNPTYLDPALCTSSDGRVGRQNGVGSDKNVLSNPGQPYHLSRLTLKMGETLSSEGFECTRFEVLKIVLLRIRL